MLESFDQLINQKLPSQLVEKLALYSNGSFISSDLIFISIWCILRVTDSGN